MSERELRNTGVGLLGIAGVTQGKGLDASWPGSKREGGGVLSYLFTENGRALEARQPASHSPRWLLRSIHRAIGEELGGLVWGGRVQAFCVLIQFEEHLLLSLLLVQIFFQSLGQREGAVRCHWHGSPKHRTPTKVPSSGNFPSLPTSLCSFAAWVTRSSIFPFPECITQKTGTTSSFLLSQPCRILLWIKGHGLVKCLLNGGWGGGRCQSPGRKTIECRKTQGRKWTDLTVGDWGEVGGQGQNVQVHCVPNEDTAPQKSPRELSSKIMCLPTIP